MSLEWVGYIAFALVGISLGLVGSGGSILTVPILAYLFGIPATVATTYSLFIVGTTALIGALGRMRRGGIDGRTVAAFGIPSVTGMLFGRAVLVPALPETLVRSGAFALSRDRSLLILFGGLMLFAAYAMLRPGISLPEEPDSGGKPHRGFVAEGFAVGTLMGLVGAGGGFLIVPALVHRAHLAMRQAVGTSLAIIAMNSALGFAGVAFRQSIEWPLLAALSTTSVAGLFIGAAMADHVPEKKLRPAFGVFVLVVGTLVIGREIWG
ncbi:MAG: sulfite exporter TauE/SafE family protein [Fimbriimonas sp.]